MRGRKNRHISPFPPPICRPLSSHLPTCDEEKEADEKEEEEEEEGDNGGWRLISFALCSEEKK